MEITTTLRDEEDRNSLAPLSLRMYITRNRQSPNLSFLKELSDNSFLVSNGWYRVFHEGYGDGICSPSEGIVVCFDEEESEIDTDVEIYKYNPKAWIKIENGSWDDIYAGNNGEDCEIELANNEDTALLLND